MVEKKTGLQIKCLRSVVGGEYLSNVLTGAWHIAAVVIPHSKMDLQKGKTGILERYLVPCSMKKTCQIFIGLKQLLQ